MEISVTGDKAISAAFNRLNALAGDMTPAMDAIGDTIAENVMLTFDLGRDPWGFDWAPLKHRDGAILRDTGRLGASIGYSADAQGVDVFTNVAYAATHQFGASKGAYGRTKRNSPIPWGDVPARPFFPITDNGEFDLPSDWGDQVIDVLQAAIHEAAGA